MSERIQSRWRQGTKTYVAIFTWAPTPFFNVVVDADRTIHPSMLASPVPRSSPQSDGGGVLDEPPSQIQLERTRHQSILESSLDPHVLDSTRTVDGKLSDSVEDCTPLEPPTAAPGQHERRHSDIGTRAG